MAVLPVLKYPNPQLSQIALPVTWFDKTLDELIKNLIDTMLDGPGAVGIAAPQIGSLVRVAIVDVSAMLQSKRGRRIKSSNNGRLFLVNPEIIQRQGEVSGREGCLSVPDYTGNVVRSDSIKVRIFSANDASKEVDCFGFESRAVQHEIDHLNGVLFLDRVISPRELFRRKIYK